MLSYTRSSGARRTSLAAVLAAGAIGTAAFAGAPVAGAETAGSARGIDLGSLSSASTGATDATDDDTDNSGSVSQDSLEDFFSSDIVQAGGMLIAGLGVAAALAIGAGLRGGAFNDVQLPFQLPF
ncbi:hypothetical protein [Dietzia sp.]|uniref:hypothetical protein n=1 Tax=Dietzia sp. TaxID=1871616 RepID=UPI002FD8A8D0